MVLSLMSIQDLYADVSVGKQIYQHCKNCHGPEGLGGEGGKYPRIAGLPQPYLEKQLSDFKHRKRLNKPMVPVFKNWRFNQDAIASVAKYVNRLSLNELNIPAYQSAPEILAQFDSPDHMVEVGEDLFQDCVQCHGEDAKGREDKKSPPLVQQYPNYLRKQIGDFAAGRRTHENSESLFTELEADEVEALLAYITSLAE
jgi:cytochrome c553